MTVPDGQLSLHLLLRNRNRKPLPAVRIVWLSSSAGKTIFPGQVPIPIPVPQDEGCWRCWPTGINVYLQQLSCGSGSRKRFLLPHLLAIYNISIYWPVEDERRRQRPFPSKRNSSRGNHQKDKTNLCRGNHTGIPHTCLHLAAAFLFLFIGCRVWANRILFSFLLLTIRWEKITNGWFLLLRER